MLRTRFYRPSLPSDLVDRPRLIDQLNRGSDRPLTLVTAPAGYGKSILVSAWLSTCERPGAWLSLDETVDDLGVFLAYFVAAIQTIFPGALRQTQTLLTAISLPPLGVLAGSLINELDEIERDFVVVLDDYHTIHQQEIHDLLTTLLRPPSQHMQLVLITRQRPAAAPERAAGAQPDDRGPPPRSAFLGRRDRSLHAECARIAPARRSGCRAGGEDGRLDREPAPGGADAALTARMLTARVADLQALERNRNLTDYLMSEVLAQTSPAIEDFLLKTAILDRMCGPLCEAVIGHDDPAVERPDPAGVAGAEQPVHRVPGQRAPLVSLPPSLPEFPAKPAGATVRCERGRAAPQPGQRLVRRSGLA